jgi:hypothetical protein
VNGRKRDASAGITYRERGYATLPDLLPWRGDDFAPKRPKDVNQAAKRIVNIATRDESDDSPKG